MLVIIPDQEMVREKNFLEGHAKVREFYFESGKIDISKKVREN